MSDETPTAERHAGRILREERAALAEAVTARHYELNPSLATRYGAAGRDKCLQDAGYHLSYLGEAAARYVEEGIKSLPQMPSELPSLFEDGGPHSALARAYIEALLGGRRREASRLVLEAVGGGVSGRDVYIHVFQRSQ